MPGDTARSPPGRGFLAGGGEMGALMRAHDWTPSPLGSPERWPDALKLSVSICLSSRFPIVLWWGPQAAMLYNDAWRPVLGETKHRDLPGALAAHAFSPVFETPIRKAAHGDSSGVRGAAWLWKDPPR